MMNATAIPTALITLGRMRILMSTIPAVIKKMENILYTANWAVKPNLYFKPINTAVVNNT